MSELENNITLDKDIAEKLRNENPEQFTTLVRMHLSFQLDLHTDENDFGYCEKTKQRKWKGFKRNTKACNKIKNTYDTSKDCLSAQGISQIKCLINFLIQEENIIQEGIFRKTGSLTRQNELKSILNQTTILNLEEKGYTSHDCASVLKSVLSDLQEPLLTEVYYPAYCQVAEIYNSNDNISDKDERILQTLQLLLLLLPKENNILLHDIMLMLNKTMTYEHSNKMSADSLATLFTPHLICPRKLAPEALHTTAASLSGIISFMITKGSVMFYTPPKLATDIRVYFVEQQRRKTMSPEQILNESTTSDSTANTVFTFVDREKTAEAHVGNSTDTALAQLYAHIQGLPESSKKKKLIKQFNKENGHGTPLQLVMLNREKNTSGTKTGKSFGDSIKKHIFHKNLISKTPKRSHTSTSISTPNGSVLNPKSRVLFQSPLCTNTNTPTFKPNDNNSFTNTPISKIYSNSTPISRTNSQESTLLDEYSHSDGEMTTIDLLNESYLKLQELAVDNSDDDIKLIDLPDREHNIHFTVENKLRYKSEPDLSKTGNNDDELMGVNESLRNDNNIKSFLRKKIIKGFSMGNLKLPFMHENRHPFKKSTFSRVSNNQSSLNNDYFVKEKNEYNEKNNDKNKLDMHDSKNEWNLSHLGLNTPDDRNSMSPITKSTQRMPKAMQESIMTPRSRKPVMLIGALLGSCEQSTSGYSNKNYRKLIEEESDTILEEIDDIKVFDDEEQQIISNFCHSNSEIDINQMNDTGLPVVSQNNIPAQLNEDNVPDNIAVNTGRESLSTTFRKYLNSRSVLTASPVDLSFSSQPDDFVSTTDVTDMSENNMSESMLFCMNGNKPSTEEIEKQSEEPEQNLVSPLIGLRKRAVEEEGDDNFIIKKVLNDIDETSL